jgi:hypothetical protein
MTDKLSKTLENVSSISLQVTKEDLIDYAIEQHMAAPTAELEELRAQQLKVINQRDESQSQERKCAYKLAQTAVKGCKTAAALVKAIKAFNGDHAEVMSKGPYSEDGNGDWFCHVAVGYGSDFYLTGNRHDLKSKQLTKLRAESDRLADEYKELSGRVNILANQVSVEAVSELRTQLRTKIVETAMKSANSELHKLLEAPKS